MRYALFEPNPFEEDECQETEIAVKNMVKDQCFPKLAKLQKKIQDQLIHMIYLE